MAIPTQTETSSAADAETMKASILSAFGDPDVLSIGALPRPEPSAGQVRVAVEASFVAFGRDVSVRSGQHPVFAKMVQLPHVLGGEHAGVVDAVGPGLDEALLGTRVAVSAPIACQACAGCLEDRPWDCTSITAIGITAQGSNAEYTTVPFANISPIPLGVSSAEAAALSASGPLAWEELQVAHAAPGDWVLVPGANGSVGTLLVALARQRGCNVIAITRSLRGADELRSLGAEAVLDAASTDLAEQIREMTPRGVNAVVDNVMDVDLWRRYWPAVAKRGHIVTAGQASRSKAPLPIDVIDFYNRRATFAGLTIGDPRSVSRFWQQMALDPIDLGELVETFPLERAADAHRRVEDGGKIGHVVLTITH